MSRIMPLLAVLTLTAAVAAAGPAPTFVEAQFAPGRDGQTTPGALTSAQQPAVVRIVDFNFTPQRLAVPAGTTVTWTNGGNAPHTATATNGAFDSKGLGNGATFNFTFSTPGTYAYQCDIHPSMTGSVTVEAPAPAPSPTAAPSTSPSLIAPLAVAQAQAAPAPSVVPSPDGALAAAVAAPAAEPPAAAPRAASNGDDNSTWFVIYAIAVLVGLVTVIGGAAWFFIVRRT